MLSLCKTGAVMRFCDHGGAADFYKRGNCRGKWVAIVLELGREWVGFLITGAQRAGGSATAGRIRGPAMAPLITIRLEAHNPSPMTGRGNNTYLLVADDREAALIDAGVGNSLHLADIDRELRARGAGVIAVCERRARRRAEQSSPALRAGKRT